MEAVRWTRALGLSESSTCWVPPGLRTPAPEPKIRNSRPKIMKIFAISQIFTIFSYFWIFDSRFFGLYPNGVDFASLNPLPLGGILYLALYIDFHQKYSQFFLNICCTDIFVVLYGYLRPDF